MDEYIGFYRKEGTGSGMEGRPFGGGWGDGMDDGWGEGNGCGGNWIFTGDAFANSFKNGNGEGYAVTDHREDI